MIRHTNKKSLNLMSLWSFEDIMDLQRNQPYNKLNFTVLLTIVIKSCLIYIHLFCDQRKLKQLKHIHNFKILNHLIWRKFRVLNHKHNRQLCVQMVYELLFLLVNNLPGLQDITWLSYVHLCIQVWIILRKNYY